MPIKKLLKKIISKKKPTNINLPIINKQNYQILTDDIPQNAINTLKKFHRAKYQAYLVGGSVRDLLLRISPKDIDIATDAIPEQIYKLFRNCRLIGKRFRLAHLLFNRSIIEVATFRSEKQQSGKHHKKNTHGMIVRDNIYGNIQEDAWRRDFSINSLYYDAVKNDLIDFTGGFADIQKILLRIIGDPDVRYREDPVRMIRAIRFSAKLEFSIERKTSEGIHTNKALISHVSTVRLFDEVIKLFHCGCAERVYVLLNTYGFFKILFPLTYKTIKNNSTHERILLYTFRSTDERIKHNTPVTPAFLFVAMLWPALQDKIKSYNAQKMSTAKKTDLATRNIITQQIETVSISKRFIRAIKEIFVLQYRLEKRRGKSPLSLLHHPRFRAAYDFLLIRAKSGEIEQGLADWWSKFQAVNEQTQLEMMNELRK